MHARPLRDTTADSRLFSPPAVWNTVWRAVELGNNVLLAADRGWGKTSMLRQLQFALRDADRPSAFVDATSVDGVPELIWRIGRGASGVPGAPQRLQAAFETVKQVVAGSESSSASALAPAVLVELDRLRDLPATTFLVDASYSASALYELFGRLRDAVWELPHQWVVAVDSQDRATVTKPPADVFFDTELQGEPWSIDDLVGLIERRSDMEELDAAIRRGIAVNAAGTPRGALRAANAYLVDGVMPAAAHRSRADLLERASLIGRPYGRLMAELLDKGQGGPSDDELIDRMGLTRGRLSELFSGLEQQGLVTSSELRSEGPGRPRKIYRPNLGQVITA